MLKQAWSTYWRSYNPKKIKIDNSRVQPFNFFWMLYIFIGVQDFEVKFYITIKMIPLVLMMWNNMVTKLYMPKAIYFTPMGEKGRREYINSLLMFKIGVPVIVNIMLHILFGIWYEFSILACLASAFAQLSMGIGMYVCCEMRSKFDRYIRYAVPGKDGKGKDAWLNYFCMILGFLGSIFCGIPAADSIGVLIFQISMLVILLIMDIVILKSRYQVTIDYICDYEEAYHILGKVITIK
jgi:uncharacterized membrane protein YoaK (UPF0700 family)